MNIFFNFIYLKYPKLCHLYSPPVVMQAVPFELPWTFRQGASSGQFRPPFSLLPLLQGEPRTCFFLPFLFFLGVVRESSSRVTELAVRGVCSRAFSLLWS